jgi:uncharacterized protein YecT (DUF1311 family)
MFQTDRNKVIRRLSGRTEESFTGSSEQALFAEILFRTLRLDPCAVRLAPALRQLILSSLRLIPCATMSRRLAILATFFACAFLHPVCAAEQLNEEQLEQLAQQYPKLYLPKLIAFTEGKLERVYQARLKASRPEYRAALQKAQEAWRKFYEADLVVGALDTEGGSGQAVFAMKRHVYQLRLRIYQLSTDFLQGWIQIPKVDEPKPR